MGELKIGDRMKIKGPKGNMTYTPNMVRHLCMIAGGTGITPMLQIVRAIVRGRPRNGGHDRTKVDLTFANVNEDDILLRKDLDHLANEDDGFRVHYVLNNPPDGWTGGVGFVTPEFMKVRLLALCRKALLKPACSKFSLRRRQMSRYSCVDLHRWSVQ